jgi:hypothetical protein
MDNTILSTQATQMAEAAKENDKMRNGVKVGQTYDGCTGVVPLLKGKGLAKRGWQ